MGRDESEEHPAGGNESRSCFVLGCGRTGTSLLAGAIAGAGYFCGDDLIKPRAANPKGFFEDRHVNRLNEQLLHPVLTQRPESSYRPGSDPRTHPSQYWLAQLPVGTTIPLPDEVRAGIEALCARQPFCFKDPRFSYTLAAWQRCLTIEPVYLCVFREPGRTATSILREATEPYLADLGIDRTGAMAVWTLMYRHILETHRRHGDWIFVHYDQILDGTGLDRVETALGTSVDRAFADPTLKRSADTGPVPDDAARTYAALCALAGHPS